jgi:uroporphyrinogen decarboxylase
MMTCKERVIRTILRKVPDRPPLFVTVTPQVAENLARHLDIPYEKPLDSLLSTRISHMDLLTGLGNDCVGIAACAPRDRPTVTHSSGIIENEWGMKFIDAGLYNEFHEFPLAHARNADDIRHHDFPDPFAAGRFDAARKAVEKYGSDYAIVADLETSFFETSWYLVGLEKLLMDLITGAGYVNPLFDRVMEINIEVGKQLIELGADILWAGDDFGTQNGMLLDPETWRNLFKPRIKIMFEEFRKVNPDIKIAWHSCGSILPIIPDFIEIGLDILNPLQPRAKGMEPRWLKETYGNYLVFFGGLDIQELLPHGSPVEIRAEVERLSGIYGRDGGYILAPAHNIQVDTPMQNIIALFEAVKNLNHG